MLHSKFVAICRPACFLAVSSLAASSFLSCKTDSANADLDSVRGKKVGRSNSSRQWGGASQSPDTWEIAWALKISGGTGSVSDLLFKAVGPHFQYEGRSIACKSSGSVSECLITGLSRPDNSDSSQYYFIYGQVGKDSQGEILYNSLAKVATGSELSGDASGRVVRLNNGSEEFACSRTLLVAPTPVDNARDQYLYSCWYSGTELSKAYRFRPLIYSYSSAAVLPNERVFSSHPQIANQYPEDKYFLVLNLTSNQQVSKKLGEFVSLHKQDFSRNFTIRMSNGKTLNGDILEHTYLTGSSGFLVRFTSSDAASSVADFEKSTVTIKQSSSIAPMYRLQGPESMIAKVQN
jgi:hypothetical protein